MATDVFPTHVGMDRALPDIPIEAQCIPHARGDGPTPCGDLAPTLPYSPRTWGWTEVDEGPRQVLEVFPTHVGMDRMFTASNDYENRIPHARGDGP